PRYMGQGLGGRGEIFVGLSVVAGFALFGEVADGVTDFIQQRGRIARALDGVPRCLMRLEPDQQRLTEYAQADKGQEPKDHDLEKAPEAITKAAAEAEEEVADGPEQDGGKAKRIENRHELGRKNGIEPEQGLPREEALEIVQCHVRLPRVFRRVFYWRRSAVKT